MVVPLSKRLIKLSGKRYLSCYTCRHYAHCLFICDTRVGRPNIGAVHLIVAKLNHEYGEIATDQLISRITNSDISCCSESLNDESS